MNRKHRQSNYCYQEQVHNSNEWEPFMFDGMELPLHQVFQLISVTEKDIDVAIKRTRDLCMYARSDENKKIGLEFLYSHGLLDELDELIATNLQTNNPDNMKWAKIYQIMNDRKRSDNSPLDIAQPMDYLNRLNDIDISGVELQCLNDFLRIFCEFDINQYRNFGTYSERLREMIQQIDDPLIRDLFSSRLDEAFAIFHWKRNEMILARKFGYRILNATKSQKKKIDIHNMMALGYLYDNYQQAMYHANEALEIAKEINSVSALQGLNNFTIPFICAYHRKTEGISSNIQSEIAHIALAKGDYKTCIEILRNAETLTPFQQYYLGKALQDEQLLQESYHRFINERSDYFYAKLPVYELRKLNAFQ
ncbi:AimR family lysis-lysogeny pheromone receptor [Aquibacillus rhizosphaerae]|uniref:AimR family lysis-lysogeny pheromone receptor n=1 Tax=Aquibacillus rhizosphaerae TaxID=3051431 RepID=A0ABT7L3C5_9BACI|nr:AimR family lysis-lysogeny pheromone receptor [Aquibacillus sp. LR5S19]MDL4839095.1 AimR family lysis-lysogeny pheromone receptor [Aquibacillus sp. LR5S19]